MADLKSEEFLRWFKTLPIELQNHYANVVYKLHSKMPVGEEILSKQMAEEVRFHVNKEIESLKKDLKEICDSKLDSIQYGIGKSGEDWFEKIFSLDPKFGIERMTQVGHSGDFHIWLKGCVNKTLAAVKKNTKPLPEEEVEKFIQDLDEADCESGMLVQLKGGFSDKHETLSIKRTTKNKPYLLIGTAHEFEEPEKIIRFFFTFMLQNFKTPAEMNGKEMIMVKHCEEMINEWGEDLKIAKKLNNQAQAHAKELKAQVKTKEMKIIEFNSKKWQKIMDNNSKCDVDNGNDGEIPTKRAKIEPKYF